MKILFDLFFLRIKESWAHKYSETLKSESKIKRKVCYDFSKDYLLIKPNISN